MQTTEPKQSGQGGRCRKITEPPGCITLADFLCCWGPSDKGMGLGGLLGRTLGSSSAQADKALLSWALLSCAGEPKH